ncbi:hypothetical protein Aca07nite_19870 [Actinoplanes capillaceus]|uniref:Uncharacterized protein n=1 Tax=Actinoplanes campanulatus TaxID=113559 RepID=A0ABQ3WCF8_9ACTN|nr:DUF6284 family protein [Actinoplanes capillaceus]GID44712.1 hypothetical protein Aca07nite_19870 [Actinoplanes capillaceus]
MSNDFTDVGDPSPADLAAIEAEWPEIQADIDALADPDAVDALVAHIEAIESGALAVPRRRRTERVLLTAIRGLVNRHVCRSSQLTEVAMTSDCRFGCKVLRCGECGGEQVSHRAAYGCPIGRAELTALRAVA